jgi:hypothetical protein
MLPTLFRHNHLTKLSHNMDDDRTQTPSPVGAGTDHLVKHEKSLINLGPLPKIDGCWPDYCIGFPYGRDELRDLRVRHVHTEFKHPCGTIEYFADLDTLESEIDTNVHNHDKAFDWWESTYSRAQIIPYLQSKLDHRSFTIFQNLLNLIDPATFEQLTIIDCIQAKDDRLQQLKLLHPKLCPILDLLKSYLDQTDYGFLEYLSHTNLVLPWVRRMINKLPQRENLIISKRFGIDDGTSHTLEEIANLLGVTRERIRQIEKRVISSIFGKIYIPLIQTHLTVSNEQVLRESHTIAQIDSQTQAIAYCAKRFSPIANFLCTVLAGSTRKWLHDYFEAVEEREIPEREFGADNVELNKALDSYASSTSFPVPLKTFLELHELSPLQINKSLPIHKAFELYGGHIIPRTTGRVDAIRCVILHNVLTKQGKPTIFRTIANYATKWFDNIESTNGSRLAMRTLSNNRHLFLNLGEFGWLGIGNHLEDSSAFEPISYDTVNDDDPPVEGIRENLRRALSTGPKKLSKLMSLVGDSYSKSSVGPILGFFPCLFERKAPGYYGLVNSKTEIDTEPLLNINDCQIYIQAIKSGLPRCTFPAWNAQLEYGWANLCRNNGEKKLLESLLSICDLNSWPLSNHEHEFWNALRQQIACYSITSIYAEPVYSKESTLNEIIRILATGIDSNYLTGWSQINLTLSKRINDSHSASHLALLTILGLVKPTNHWQVPHQLTTRAQAFYSYWEAQLPHSNWGTMLAKFAVVQYDKLSGTWLELYEYNQIVENLSNLTPLSDIDDSDSIDDFFIEMSLTDFLEE